MVHSVHLTQWTTDNPEATSKFYGIQQNCNEVALFS